ncbi:MAG TPA: hypothetical protein VLQ52_05935 [Coriobacteriia bacterium]|nr:hypothetical protein [Coriobacteriia bacterium]
MDDPLLRFIGRALRGVLILAVVGVIANDGFRAVSAFSRTSEALNAAMGAAISAGTGGSTAERAEQDAATAASELGGALERYEQRDGDHAGTHSVLITLAVSSPIERTLVVGPVASLLGDAPIEESSSGDAPTAGEPSRTAARVTLAQTKQVDVIGAASQ